MKANPLLPKLSYRTISGYKYELTGPASLLVPELRGFPDFKHEYFSLRNGVIAMRKGYCWDGVSGPAIDTPDTMLAGLVHDVLYQAIRLGLLPPTARADADAALFSLLRQSGAPWWRATYFFVAVRLFGARHAKPETNPNITI